MMKTEIKQGEETSVTIKINSEEQINAFQAKINYDENLWEEIDENNFETQIEVDGGINLATCEKVKKAGANLLVAGTAILMAKDYKDIISKENEKILNSIIQVYLKNDFLSKIKLLFNRNFRSNNIKENLKFNYDVIFNKIYSKKEMEEK